jgi:acetyl-CoA acetyltransferase family protein
MGKAEAPFSREVKVHDTTIGWRFVNPRLHEAFGTHSMPQTADNVAADFAVGREDQDRFAVRSQQRWAAANEAGFFKREIVPVEVPQKRGEPRLFDTDEHPRPGVTLESLGKLKGVNGPDLPVTAGNSSGVNDGACALLIASEGAARRHGLEPKARVVAMATAGVPPRVMGIGPVPASRKVLERAGLALEAMGVVELNEAFAAQALAVLRELGLPDDAAHVNPNGGAIAIGHPLGMSGARLVTTAINQLHRTRGRYALCTMCIGVGQGIAMVVERV